MNKRVDAHTHADERLNIPPAEMEPFVTPQDREAMRVEIGRRDPGLDPQLVWRDKAESANLEVPAPPIYLQEQVHPKALIEDLRARRDKADDLFAHFGVKVDTGVEVEFYSHPMRWSNRMILGDALQVMTSLAEREGLRGKIQAIYIDPPYGIRFNSNFQWSTTSRDVTDGKLEHLTREPEQVKAFRDTWRDGIHSYLSYLRDRLVIARDLLTNSGSCFIQIGDENIHRVRMLIDEVFGSANFVSQIVVKKTTAQTSAGLPGAVDYVLFYAKNCYELKYRQLYKFKEIGGIGSNEYQYARALDGNIRRLTKLEFKGIDPLREGEKAFASDNLTSQRPPGQFEVKFEGIPRNPGAGYWKTGPEQFPRLIKAERTIPTRSSLKYRRYFDDFSIMAWSNYWDDTSSGASSSDPKVYVVQTVTRIIQRCLLMATDPGDLVLDPTCGSGTTATVAEQWGRRWITIDTSRVALALARSRIMGTMYPWYILADSPEGQKKIAEMERRAPAVHATTGDLRQGFVYERVPHITLKSIANDAEIDSIWDRIQPAVEAARAKLNAALAGHSEPFPVATGGRAGQFIDFASPGVVALPSGEEAPANEFMEWEIPREPESQWPANQAALHAEARSWSKEASSKRRAKAEAALTALNEVRSQTWDFDALPARPVTPWPDEAASALRTFWEARIARQREIDASIAARGDHVYLYDKPHEDKKRIRVAGPFTVETLSPHRTPTVGPDGDIFLVDDPASGDALSDAPEGERDAFFRAILENLKSAGVHQQTKGDRIEFSSVQPWPGRYVGAEGRYNEGECERRAAVMVGPEYGTVQRADIVLAAREAREADFDILVACAFNFDAHADLDRMGPLPILRARMNPDLHMAGDLKAGGGNLFVVFGEPDIVIHRDGDMLRVEIKGVDVFRPQSGEVDCVGPDGIACWFIDTDYTGESFFVRHAYFLGAGDPYKSLRTTLKDEIDREAWESLNSAISRPFPRPEGGKIAVKAINHLGDEVMRVFDV